MQSMEGLPDCETEKVEQFVRFGRIYCGQIVAEKVSRTDFFSIQLISNHHLLPKKED